MRKNIHRKERGHGGRLGHKEICFFLRGEGERRRRIMSDNNDKNCEREEWIWVKSFVGT